MKRLLSALLVALALQACQARETYAQDTNYTIDSLFSPIEIRPTAFHSVIYALMEQCTGLDGDLSKVRWFVAQAMVVEKDGIKYLANGLWRSPRYTPDSRPYILTDYSSSFDGETVSHEILHDLYGGDAPLDVAQRCMLTWRTLSVIK